MWLQSFVRSEGHLKGYVVSNDGQAELWERRRLYALQMPITKARTVSAVTNLSEWTNDGAVEYLEAFKYSRIEENQHDVFSFRQGTYKILVPALLFIKAMFPPSSRTFRFIYSPCGLSQICTPIVAGGSADIVLTGPEIRSTTNTQHIREIFRWVAFFPSATRAWASVYQFAAKGQCSITLPDAEATISFRGKLIGRVLYASTMNVIKLRALDAPLQWVGEQPSETIYRHIRPSIFASPSDTGAFPKGEAGWAMTDAEWDSVAHLFPSADQIVLARRRATLDAVVEKLSAGTGWKLANWRAGIPSGVASSYYSLRRNGKWAKFENILRSIREAPRLDEESGLDSSS